jgi:cystathionine gamma-synthase
MAEPGGANGSGPARLPAGESGPASSTVTAAAATTTTKGPGALAAHFGDHKLGLSSLSVHADDYINSHRAVAPALHMSTTFRYNDDPDRLRAWDNTDDNAPYDSHICKQL